MREGMCFHIFIISTLSHYFFVGELMNCLKRDIMRRISIEREKQGRPLTKEEYDELATNKYAILFEIFEKEREKNRK